LIIFLIPAALFIGRTVVRAKAKRETAGREVRKSERFKFDVFKREIPRNEKPKVRKKQDNDPDYYEEPLAHLNAPKAAKKSPRPVPDL
jgi:hypothetical protein